MAQVIFGPDASCANGDLDANFGELYGKQAWATTGIGYATGAGGGVTQSTNKATTVVLNKMCGQITMNAASPGGRGQHRVRAAELDDRCHRLRRGESRQRVGHREGLPRARRPRTYGECGHHRRELQRRRAGRGARAELRRHQGGGVLTCAPVLHLSGHHRQRLCAADDPAAANGDHARCAVQQHAAHREISGADWLGAGNFGSIDVVSDAPGDESALRFDSAVCPPTALRWRSVTRRKPGARATLSVALLDPVSKAIADVLQIFRGYVDQMPISYAVDASSIGVICTHRGETFSRPKPLRNTDADQQRPVPGDTSRRFVVSQSQVQDVWPAASFYRQ